MREKAMGENVSTNCYSPKAPSRLADSDPKRPFKARRRRQSNDTPRTSKQHLFPSPNISASACKTASYASRVDLNEQFRAAHYYCY
jgi:hypothetical protein